MVKTTRKQREALYRLWSRDGVTEAKRSYKTNKTYREFRKTVEPEFYGKAVMVPLWGMWIGIEEDGYAHS